MDASLIPPVEFLFDGSSSVEQFVAFGEGFVRNILIPRAGLMPSDVFLDLGCGNGSVARALTSYLQAPGRYEGLDINGDSVKWLGEHYAEWPAFRFTHANVFNKMYNPGATVTAAEYRLPYEDGTFTQALLKSVFTHMHPRDVRHYLRELGRVIKPGGRAVVTYFLLNDESRAFVAKDMDVVKMKVDWDGDPLCRVANLEVPENATAHDEARVRGYTAEAGFSVSEITYGNWCGRQAAGLQDVMVLTRSYPQPIAATPQPDQVVLRLHERVAELEGQLAHWQHVAEERRLKRRLARRIGDWPFLR
jgi:SAM-dependent methyltransferase